MTPPRRLQSQTERDIEGLAERKRRESAPVEVDEEVTGKHEGDELARLRAQRPTDQRIARLEEKHDDLSKSVSRMEGKLDTAIDFIKVKASEDGMTARSRISTNGKVMIAIGTAAIGALVTILTQVL